jgi:hypothetical protein
VLGVFWWQLSEELLKSIHEPTCNVDCANSLKK